LVKAIECFIPQAIAATALLSVFLLLVTATGSMEYAASARVPS